MANGERHNRLTAEVAVHIHTHFHTYHSETPGRMDEILGLLHSLVQKVHKMSGTVDTLAAEVAELQTNMTALHAGVSDIQARLTAALAGATGTDPAALAELHSINTDLAAVVASMAPPVSA